MFLAVILVANLTIGVVPLPLELLVLMFPPLGMLTSDPLFNPAIAKSNAFAPSGKVLFLMLI